MKVAAVPFTVADPATVVAPALSWKVDVLTFFTASLNVAVIAALTATPACPLAGFVELTVGGVVSDGAGKSVGSPGNVRAVISSMLVDPSPSESSDSTAVRAADMPKDILLTRSSPYALYVDVPPEP